MFLGAMEKFFIEFFEGFWRLVSIGDSSSNKKLSKKEFFPLIVFMIVLTVIELFVYLWL